MDASQVPFSALRRIERRCYAATMKRPNAAEVSGSDYAHRYICPQNHATYTTRERGLERPATTVVICRGKNADGTPCNRFAIFADGPN
jgi:hypothetical protein